MATYIRTLTDYESNLIYPHSTAEAIQRQGGEQNNQTNVEGSLQYLEGLINTKASLADVNSAIDALLGAGAAASLQTLQSLSTALGDDTNFAQNMLTALNTKQDTLTAQQCGTSLLATNGISDNNNTIPTTANVKTYVDSGLNTRISAIVFDGQTYAPTNNNTQVTLNTTPFIKSDDAGTAQSPVPINANTLQGHDYNDIVSTLSITATESSEDEAYGIVCWNDDDEEFNYSNLINMNPQTGNITAGKVYNAVYNDYAEWFEKDDYNEDFQPGDVCTWTGNGVIKSSLENDTSVVGVVSDNYGHIIGGDKISNMEDNNKKFVPIGLAGRVNVKVIGEVEIGDLLVAGPKGCAIVNNEAIPNMIIGKALENSYNPSQKKIQMLIK